MKIKKNQSIYKFLISLAFFGIISLTSFGYFLGWSITREGILIYFVIIIIEIIIGFLVYFLIDLLNKTYYIITKDEIVKIIKDGTIKVVYKWCEVVSIHYVRIWWLLLMQFGSGCLMFKYKKNNEKEMICEIAMTKKQVKQIYKLYGIKIEVR